MSSSYDPVNRLSYLYIFSLLATWHNLRLSNYNKPLEIFKENSQTPVETMYLVFEVKVYEVGESSMI